MKKIKKSFVYPIMIAVLSGIAISIWQYEFDKVTEEPKELQKGKVILTENNSSVVREIRVVDTVFVERPIYISSRDPAKTTQNRSQKITSLIAAFDRSSKDNINTQIVRSISDTLSDGTISRRRKPIEQNKTAEQTFIEMKSANSKLISLLKQYGLNDKYVAVLSAQKELLNLAGEKFKGNIGSPLCGIE